MTHQTHSELVQFIWNIANKLRGPYGPTAVPARDASYDRAPAPRLRAKTHPRQGAGQISGFEENKKLNEEALGKVL